MSSEHRELNPALLDAIEALDPQPRSGRWASLSYCILDAVWSIGARYDAVVVPLVRRISELAGDTTPLIPPGSPPPDDPMRLERFLARYPDTMALQAITNAQRTSTRAGIAKADAALRFARVFAEQGINDLSSAATLVVDGSSVRSQIDHALAAVPGAGRAGIRLSYLWMLVGDDDAIKPDRMVLRWLARHAAPVSPVQARVMLHDAASALSKRLHRPVTPWMVDHAIWRTERAGGAPAHGLHAK
ncbi:hypothetical protein [Actinoplanes sp. NPDC051859]|uniref:hypothetical protein n=1 Tax=Actinoplanes sp. NPDC051859 TaxID=3363909 RepID=UPI00379EE822